MPLIELRRLTKYYKMGDSVVRALDGVDLTIDRGEFVAITGASGSGKSTMMHLLGCLDRPTSGTYLLDGRDVSSLSDAELAAVRNRQVGFVFQTFNLINRTLAWENVAVPLFYARKSGLHAPAVRALERVGLASRATHQPNELSGGERQRVAIARAIVNDPLLLLADEPTGNLDTRTGEQIMQIVHELNQQDVTIIMVTHEWEIALQAQRIVQMRDGKIVSDRLSKDILAEEGRPAPQIHAARSAEPVMDAAAEPAPEAESAAADTSAMPPRVVRGATAGLICGVVAVACLLGMFGISIGLQMAYDMEAIQQAATQQPPEMPPIPVIVLGILSFVAMLAGIVCGILALVFSLGARKRMRTEIGNWVGRWRIWVGLITGAIALGTPLVMIAIRIVQFSLRQG